MERDVSTWMREDWDARAREKALYYIVTNAADSIEQFTASADDNMVAFFSDINDLVPGHDAALEIGCGIGRLLRPFAKTFAKVYGCDVSPEMIERSVPYLQDLDNVEAWVNNGRTLQPVPDGIVDFVFSYLVFQHIPDREVILGYIRDVFRVLKPGGIFRFQVPGLEESPEAIEAERVREKSTWVGCCFAPSEIAMLVRDLGFEAVSIRTIPANFLFVFVTRVSPSNNAGARRPWWPT